MTIKISNCDSFTSTLAAIAAEIPPVICRDGRQYPFVGEKGVRRALDDRPELKMVNAILMYWLQTENEQATKSTVVKNRRGLMSSHAATASKVIEAVLAGADLDPDQVYKADGASFTGTSAYLEHVGGRYAKQLSVALRSWAIAQEPELGVTAGMFSVR